MFQFPRTSLAVLATTLLLTACGTAPTKQASPSSARTAEEIVRERAAARWELLVKRDFAAAYDYLSAGTRSVKTREAYAAEMAPRPVKWTGAEVTGVDCPAGEAFCSVNVVITFEVKSPVRGVGTVSSRSGVEERWVVSRGEWGYVPQEIVRQ